MAVLDFPSAPVYGQVYSKWTWDGGRWTCGLLPPPPPTITAIDPTEVVTGSAAFVLTVVGTNFLADSVINYGGSDVPTTFVDATILVAQAVTPPAVDGTKMVYVRNGANVSTSVPIVFSAAPPPAGKPEWVPADALLAIDFIAPGRSWDGTTEGDGSATGIGSMIGADPLVMNSGYDPTGLSATGYDYRDATSAMVPAYIGALKTALLADVTFTVDFMPAPTGDLPPQFTIRSADGLSGLDIKASGSNILIQTPTGLALTLPSVYYTSMLNRIAVTITQTRIEVACNGFGQVEGTLIAADRPAPWESIYENGTDLQAIRIYPLLPTTAGLMELSSTL